MDKGTGASTRALSDLIAHVKQNGLTGLLAIHGLERLELLRWSDAMVETYGKVYQKHKALVMDEQLLPCPKADLRAALKVAFHTFALKQNVDAMEGLARAYLNISRFQSITAEDKLRLEELNLPAVPMVDMEKVLAGRADITEQEQRFLECFRTFHDHLGIVEREKESLRQDFDAFVHESFGKDQTRT